MIDKNSENDAKFMRLALKEAEKGIGLTSPNPTVGSVIVKKGKIIGRGYHQKAGGPHAEIEAIRNLFGKNARQLFINKFASDKVFRKFMTTITYSSKLKKSKH